MTHNLRCATEMRSITTSEYKKQCDEQLEITLAKLGYTGMRRKLYVKQFWKDPAAQMDKMFVQIKNENKLTKGMCKARWYDNFDYIYEKNDYSWGSTMYDVDEWNEKYPLGHPEHIP